MNDGPKTPKHASGSHEIAGARAVWCRNIARQAMELPGTAAAEIAARAINLEERFVAWTLPTYVGGRLIPATTDIAARGEDSRDYERLVADAEALGIAPW